MTEYRTVTDTKAHLNEIVDSVHAAGESVVITRNGLPAALIVSVGEYSSLLETLEVLGGTGASEEISAAEARIDSGEYLTAEDIRREFLRRAG